MIVATLLFAGILCASAPQEPDTLDAARVRAGRDAAAASASVVRRAGKAALERGGSDGISEVLRTFAGVSVRDYGGIGGLKTVSVRGLGSQHTSVCRDGIPISDAQNGQVDISRYGVDDLEELAVAIGAADDIFHPARTSSSAGVLDMTTSSLDHTRLSASMRMASFGTYNPRLRGVWRMSDKWASGISGGWLNSRGDYPFTLHNGSIVTDEVRLGGDVTTLDLSANARGKLAGGELAANVAAYSSERGLPGSVVLYTQNPTERLWDRDLRASISYEREWNLLKMRTYGIYSDAWNRYTNTSALYAEPQDDRYRQREAAAGVIAMYGGEKGLRGSIAQDIFLNTLEATTPECPFPQRLSAVTTLSGQYVSDRLRLTASLTSTNTRERVSKGEAASPIDRLTPQASASYTIGERSMLRASVKEGFRVPTFNDLYYARVGNTSLRPEKAFQAGAGYTYSDGIFSLTADAYAGNVRDKIVAVPTMFIWKMHNVDRVRMAGAEVAAEYRRRIWKEVMLHANASYSFQYAVDVTDPESKCYLHQIQYTPRHSGSGVLALQTPWVDFTYTVVAAGVRYNLAQNSSANRMEPYADHSVSIRRAFVTRLATLKLAAEALNLAGTNYEIVRYYPMPGRNYRITLTITI